MCSWLKMRETQPISSVNFHHFPIMSCSRENIPGSPRFSILQASLGMRLISVHLPYLFFLSLFPPPPIILPSPLSLPPSLPPSSLPLPHLFPPFPIILPSPLSLPPSLPPSLPSSPDLSWTSHLRVCGTCVCV